MGRNSSRKRWMPGRIAVAFNSSLVGSEHRPTTPTSRPSTVDSARSVWINTGLAHWKKHERRSKRGARITTPRVRIARSTTRRRPPLLPSARKMEQGHRTANEPKNESTGGWGLILRQPANMATGPEKGCRSPTGSLTLGLDQLMGLMTVYGSAHGV